MKQGDPVAAFSAKDQEGTERTLGELTADGPLVLFFYPKAMTPG